MNAYGTKKAMTIFMNMFYSLKHIRRLRSGLISRSVLVSMKRNIDSKTEQIDFKWRYELRRVTYFPLGTDTIYSFHANADDIGHRDAIAIIRIDLIIIRISVLSSELCGNL